MFAKRFPIGTFLIVLVMQNTFLSSELGAYLMSFLIGFIWSLNAEKLRCYTTKIPKVVSIFICICLIAGTILLRQNASNYLASIKCDTYLATCICLLILACKPYRLKIDTVLGFLGKHSINIYLMHTFVFYYFFKEQIYNIQSKFLIFIVVLGICLLFSVALELLKKKLKYGRLVEKVANLIERRGI